MPNEFIFQIHIGALAWRRDAYPLWFSPLTSSTDSGAAAFWTNKALCEDGQDNGMPAWVFPPIVQHQGIILSSSTAVKNKKS